MSLLSDNADFEAWLRTQCQVVDDDLKHKHKRMKKDPFTFLRATFFRWAKTIEQLCPDLSGAPAVLSVGDTHTENFGTWRDADGRWVWGINDFDEASVIPYPLDLVRLATSVALAPGLALGDGGDAAKAIAAGYRRGLDSPAPTLLDETAIWLWPSLIGSDEGRRDFWDEVGKYPAASPPKAVVDGLARSLPSDAVIERFASRRKGDGSLGRPRFVAIAQWRGGTIIREAKALVPSAWDWAHGRPEQPSAFLDLAEGKFRSPDPILRIEAQFVMRRVAVDSHKIELGDDAGIALTLKRLDAMGFDLGSIHAASAPQAGAIRGDLDARSSDWLDAAAKVCAASVRDDYATWKSEGE